MVYRCIGLLLEVSVLARLQDAKTSTLLASVTMSVQPQPSAVESQCYIFRENVAADNVEVDGKG